jgi:hypothetical protein
MAKNSRAMAHSTSFDDDDDSTPVAQEPAKVEVKVAPVQAPVKAEAPALVRVLSLRPGDVILPGGVVLSYKKTVSVSAEQANNLVMSEPDFFQIV